MVKIKKVSKVKEGVTRQDIGVLGALLLLMFVLVMVGSDGDFSVITGKVIEEVPFVNEVWSISECSARSAEDAAVELNMNYGCTNHCYDAAYGIKLPYNLLVNLECAGSDERSRWIEDCSESFSSICA
ncbi:hypothetical protein HN992_03705 [Candidatus Woesearchaeota archaeon]|jgi:hypothetical protein|nr:hypothetical protein [Candidatus Woesearchaeota archaeon]MBT3438812.1 hypothetical protein [Candidatus Woesearchaeota archaeon]MBT4058516.1 hypothetical protein [Candidatus Woesearchaeota archaeon]MBT4207138.1 hypothetical protein [Candidatus Woesearchaeota archaeon]MBT4732523.1 hypothetical protein [Candidatus Woesearchaeota archaeon]